MNYIIHKTAAAPGMEPVWESPAWAGAETLEITNFRPESSSHRPRARARLLHDANGIHGIFQVRDQYVRCVRTNYFDEVWKDSCVEFFAQPMPDRGYFNFEFNCGGAFLCCHIVNSEPSGAWFKEFVKIPPGIGRLIQARSSLPAVVEPEITQPLAWALRFFIPWAVFEHYVGPLGTLTGQAWRGNFFKCAEENSHPHWASWSPVDEFNFHRPGCFGTIQFG